MKRRYAPENTPRDEETLLAPYSQEDVPLNVKIPAPSSDIALRSALRRLRANMLKIVERQVATPHELWSLLEEQKELRGMLSTRTPLRNSVEMFLDLLEASLRAKMQLR
ncbi:uncharacterized protein LOC119766903 [Culex quinquefasciatus]|uniref:uncharacterized protein LOC119766903 n=1 Tax=Culex quinquefasciatus TaxID=7176 RepID=UPI0018E3B8AD|nr:uncharacterized protein LOC119766903 [Culex quinquefasciatus]XP_038109285.1 uncharacterized protein LOC119766903 [Culex quinquefasciatus]